MAIRQAAFLGDQHGIKGTGMHDVGQELGGRVNIWGMVAFLQRKAADEDAKQYQTHRRIQWRPSSNGGGERNCITKKDKTANKQAWPSDQ